METQVHIYAYEIEFCSMNLVPNDIFKNFFTKKCILRSIQQA